MKRLRRYAARLPARASEEIPRPWSGARDDLVSDVWNVFPEDEHNGEYHYASFPEDLVKNPIALTCPEGGIVLDPFVGTGTTCRVAQEMGRKSVGIESSAVYMKLAREGCNGNASF